MDLYSIYQKFRSEKSCHEHLKKVRWPNGVICPFCEGKSIHHRKDDSRMKCKSCNSSFSSTSKTIFHSTKLPLLKWFAAISVIISAKKGISSLQLARTINVNKNTAWYLQMRLRKAMKEEQYLKGLIEIDETYIGGNLANMSHKRKQKVNPFKSGMVHKTPVLGLLERKGPVMLKVLNHASAKTIRPLLKQSIDASSKVVTDGFGAYYGIGNYFEKHVKLNHEKEQRAWARYNTSSLEGFFSTIKRAIIGQYHKVTEHHLQSYMDEISFKKNNPEEDVFELLIFKCLNPCAIY